MRVMLCMVILAACGGDTDLDENQGVCTDLDENTCTIDPRCQQAYTDSGWQPAPFAGTCALIERGTAAAGACESLSFDDCRTRNDCSLIYWQDLGSDDSPVGDPYYKRCATEGALGE